MRIALTSWKKAVVGISGLVLGLGGSCLPENLFANTAGEIVNGLILFGINAALSGAGVQL